MKPRAATRKINYAFSLGNLDGARRSNNKRHRSTVFSRRLVAARVYIKISRSMERCEQQQIMHFRRSSKLKANIVRNGARRTNGAMHRRVVEW